MKPIKPYLKSFLFALAIASASTGCSITLTTSRSEITTTANFDTSRPTGWTTESGAPISFSVSTILSGVQTLQCRSALKTLISSATFTDCTSGTYAPTETAGRTNAVKNDNGTYTLEVRGLGIDGSVVSTTTTDYYVHPSLNSVPSCTQTFTDEQYFAAAASYLSMTTPFGSQTDLKAPFYTIEFNRTTTQHPNDYNRRVNLRKLVSLRKSIKANGNRTLMILKHSLNRSYTYGVGHQEATLGTGKAKYRPGVCDLSVTITGQGTKRSQWDRTSDGMGGYIANEITRYESFATPYGRLNYNYITGEQQTNSTIYNQIIAKGHRVRKAYGSSHSRAASSAAWGSYFSENSITNNMIANSFQCEAVVFNALGKGICFRNGTLAGPIPLRAVAPLMSNMNKAAINNPNTDPSNYVFRRAGGDSTMSNPKLVNDGSNPFWNSFAATYPTEAATLIDNTVDSLNP